MMDRRKFLKISQTGLLLGAGGFMPWKAFGNVNYQKLTILHTNDVHSRIDPFPMDGSKLAGKGGAAKRATLIRKIRSVENNVLLLDAGDIFQGTPYFNVFGGELEFKLMSEMQYDAATIGNHDFDAGIEGLAKQMPYASFPLVNCNYDFSNTIMDGQVKDHIILDKQGIKVGITGVGVELDGLVPAKAFKETKYLDPITKANAMAAYLKKEQKCDFVICLSHLGYTYPDETKISDINLAKQSKNIDLIIGGHTHTFLDKPHVERNLDGDEVMINQVGWAGVILGRIDIYFEHNRKHRCLGCSNEWVG